MTTIQDLPKGWATASLGEVATYQNGRAFKPSEWGVTGIPIIRIQNLNNASADFNFSNKPHEEKFRVRNGDLLYAWSASLGAYIWKGEDAWLNQHIFRVDHTKMIDRLFFYYTLTNITAMLYDKAHGSGMVHVTKGRFEETSLRLPPLSEQHRIVAKLEELLSELDKGIEAFKTAREQLTVYRQAVLKHAFEGKLTEEWRKKHADELEPAEILLEKIKAEREQRYRQQLKDWNRAVKAWEAGGKEGKKPTKPVKPKELPPLTQEVLAELPELPDGWKWCRAGWLFESVTSGSRGWAKHYSDKGAVFIRITNLDFDSLKLDLSKDKIQHVDPPNNAEGLRTRVQEGDFLFSITGYLGMFAIAPNLYEAYVNQHIALARPLSGFSKEYFGYYVTAKTGGHHHFKQTYKRGRQSRTWIRRYTELSCTNVFARRTKKNCLGNRISPFRCRKTGTRN